MGLFVAGCILTFIGWKMVKYFGTQGMIIDRAMKGQMSFSESNDFINRTTPEFLLRNPHLARLLANIAPLIFLIGIGSALVVIELPNAL